MTSLRHDRLTDRTVVVAPSRAHRPLALTRRGILPSGPDPCPFCVGQEAATPPELDRQPDNGHWLARSFSNLHPFVAMGTEAPGHHEVLALRGHDEDLGAAPREVAEAFLRLARDRVTCHLVEGHTAVLFVNHGRGAGASLPHPHAQLVTTPWIPPLLQTEASTCAGGDCPVCADVDDPGRLVLLETDDLVAWCAHAPSHPHELRIAPRDHLADWTSITTGMATALPSMVRALADSLGGETAYNVVWHAGVPGMHPHVHVWAASATWAGYEHGAGVPIVATDPEATAVALRAQLRA